ncbi:GTPase IMAP family member 8-like isoform X2 [Genypterus blacodes]|uniref:GTPase IMAP family member 8-like isoform X2 n=1 Tax=Genypterus blacodes TaxID=154954 RepID=UPI003F7687CF
MAEGGLQTKKALRLVLLGWATSGKSASGNTILGRDEFISRMRSSKCVSGHAQVAGREVTVVDTPGWTDELLCDTAESIQADILSCGFPEPDAVLLLIPLHIDVTESYIQSLIDHVSLLGDSVWMRAMVLFTFGNCLQNQTIESRIERNTALQYVTQLCRDRCHVFDNSNRKDFEQVENVLMKIESLLLASSFIKEPEEVKFVSDEKEETDNTAAAQSAEDVCEEPITGGAQCFPELRMVLLGLSQSGKSSTGNTILGSPKFGEWTAKSQQEEAVVGGRRLVVLDTPPWQMNTEISPDQNIVNWICQCPPGPHALLFVQNLCSKFTEGQWKFVQRYMGLLGTKAWEHVIIIFTGGDIMQDLNTKVRGRDSSLQKLLDMCGNRHYIFNNRLRGHSTQVTELLEGIERLSSQHKPGFFQMNQTIAASMEEINKALQEKAQRRIEKVAARERAHSVVFREGKAYRLGEVRLVLLGEQRSGKSTAAKTMANLEFHEDRYRCVATKTITNERIVLIVDTPGWAINTWRKVPQKTDSITEALSLCQPGPHAFLIVVSLRRTFTETHRVAMEDNLACLSEAMWKNAMVLFTCGEELQEETIEMHIEKEGEALKWLVDKCNNRYHVFSKTPFNDLPQVKELLESIDKMVGANSGQYFSNILAKIHKETCYGEETTDPVDREDDDDELEYTPRERKVMEKMMKEIRERLQVDIKSYLWSYMKRARSLPFSNPSNVPAPSEDELTGRGKGIQQRDVVSSGFVSLEDQDMDFSEQDGASVSL